MTSATFRFLTAGDIRFGRGEAQKSIPELATLPTPILLVHGRDASRAQWLVDALKSQGATVQGVAIPKEPDVAMIEGAVAHAKQWNVQSIIALGGGAVIDAGKAIAALVPAKRHMMEHLEVVGDGRPLEVDPLPFIALPTTAGTGAEVTKNAVLSVPEAKRKVSLRDNRMLADMAIIDPSLTDNLPRSVTLASGLDAVTQVIEPYVSSKANWMTDALCASSIASGMNALVSLMKEETQEARDALAWTSLCGGLALVNSGLGAVHGLAGVLGGVLGAPHGALCGRLLPHVLAANEQAIGASVGQTHLLQRFDEIRYWISQAIDCPQQMAFADLANWADYNGLPKLAALGLSADTLPQVAQDAQTSSSMKGNPVMLSANELEDILQAAL